MQYSIPNRTELSASEKNDVILQENDGRWVIFPIKFNAVWDHFKKTETAFWTAEEIDMTAEPRSVEKLTPETKAALAQLAIYELAANGALFPDYLDIGSELLMCTTIPEARAFAGFHSMKEVIHKEFFGRVANLFLPTPEEKIAALAPLKALPAVQAKIDFINRHLEKSAPFAEKLLASVIMKRIFTATSRFVPVMTKQTGESFGAWALGAEHVSIDDWLEGKFYAHLHSMLSTKLGEQNTRGLISEAVAIEKDFCRAVLSESVAGSLNIATEDAMSFIDYSSKLVEFDFTFHGGKSNPLKDSDAGVCKPVRLSEKHIYESSLVEGQKGDSGAAAKMTHPQKSAGASTEAPGHQPATSFSMDADF